MMKLKYARLTNPFYIQLRPRTFFEGGIVGHVSLADPYDGDLGLLISKAVGKEGVLQGGVKLHETGTVVCIGMFAPWQNSYSNSSSSALTKSTPLINIKKLIYTEGPQFSTRAESRLFRTLSHISCINMSACPEASLFREAEIAYALLCMSTDYDSWHPDTAAVDVEMVMGHMRHNGLNARRAVEAVLEAVSQEGWKGKEEIMAGKKWAGAVGIVTATGATEETAGTELGSGSRSSARERLAWLFEGSFLPIIT